MKFINRSSELDQIRALILTARTPIPVFIKGDGGMGKSRLLSEIAQQYQTEYYYKIVQLDFDNYRELFLPSRVELEIAKQFSADVYKEVENRIVAINQMRARGDSQQTLDEQRDQLHKFIADNIQKTSPKVLFLLDTVEKLDYGGEVALDTFTKVAKQISRCALIFAGRPVHSKGESVKIWDDVLKKLQPLSPRVLHLQPFDSQAVQEYLQAKEQEIYTYIPDSQKQALGILARGMPIFLDLAVEFTARSIDLSILLDVTPQSFAKLTKQQQQAKYAAFEKQLVQYLQRLEKPLDRLAALLAHVYPIGVSELTELMGIQSEDAENLFNQAKTLVFVKTLPDGRITLHDEMRRMVREYVWEEIDQNKEERKEYSRIAESIARANDQRLREQKRRIEENLEELQQKQTNTLIEIEPQRELERVLENVERQREVATETWLFHAGYHAPAKTFDELAELIERVRRGRKFTLAERLLEHANRWETALSSEQTHELAFLRARQFMDFKKFQEARTQFENLLGQYHAKKSNILNLLGVIETQLGNTQKALEYEQECLKILWGEYNRDTLEEIPLETLESVMYVSNWTGYICRLLGDNDKNYLVQAVNHYEKAIAIGVHLLQQENFEAEKQNSARTLIASALNNQGYIYGLQGDHRRALLRCNQAIDIWQDTAPRQIAFAEIAKGISERDQNNYADAINLFERAIERLKLPDDAEYICRAQFHLGWARWFLAEKDERPDMALLVQAEQDLMRAQKYAEDYNIRRELPGIYHQHASVLWRIGRLKKDNNTKQQARALNKCAIEISTELNNLRYLIDSIVGEAEFDWDEGYSEKMGEYQQQIQAYQAHETFPLYLGRMQRILGDFAIKQGDLHAARQYYAQGFKQMNRHGGYGPYAIERELQRFGDLLEKFVSNKKDAVNLLKYLEDHWQNTAEGKVDLKDWCHQQKIHFALFGSATK